MKEKNRTWGKWYLKGLAFLATGIFTSMAAGLSVMAQTELTFTEKLTIEEVRELSEPEKDYEDENGIRYELKHWELQEKEGEEITRTLEKRVEYPKVEAAEEVPAFRKLIQKKCRDHREAVEGRFFSTCYILFLWGR